MLKILSSASFLSIFSLLGRTLRPGITLKEEKNHGKQRKKYSQELRLSEKIIRKKDSKKEFQKMLIKKHSPLKSVLEISL